MFLGRKTSPAAVAHHSYSASVFDCTRLHRALSRIRNCSANCVAASMPAHLYLYVESSKVGTGMWRCPWMIYSVAIHTETVMFGSSQTLISCWCFELPTGEEIFKDLFQKAVRYLIPIHFQWELGRHLQSVPWKFFPQGFR